MATVKIIEFTDKVTVTYDDGSVKVFSEQTTPVDAPSFAVPIGTTVKLVAE